MGMGVSNLAQFLGEPLVVRLLDSQVDWTLNVILGVGVEAGRDDDKIGLERGDGKEMKKKEKKISSINNNSTTSLFRITRLY